MGDAPRLVIEETDGTIHHVTLILKQSGASLGLYTAKSLYAYDGNPFQLERLIEYYETA